MHPRQLQIKDYTYELPAERIAAHPLSERDESRLLIYKDERIQEDSYKKIADHLPAGCTLVFNNTKVIPARVLFKKETGAVIEIFCLEPVGIEKDYASVLNKTNNCSWKVMIGGAAKWKAGTLKKQLGENSFLEVALLEKLPEAYIANFKWQPSQLTFAEVIEKAGDVPLPPYIKRDAEPDDKIRYQTVYASTEGSVAAPTAGLHFTENIFEQLSERNITTTFLTLHVGAGTFKPVKAAQMKDHSMHGEWMEVNLDMIMQLMNHNSEIIAVGTTAARTLESLYWIGVKVNRMPEIKPDRIRIKQWEVYDELRSAALSKKDAFESLLRWMKLNNTEKMFCQTELLIAPGYSFKTIDALITNFHQPASTLLLLVAAAVGDDWRKIYQHALDHDFRFLSYGDGSLLYIKK